jgi:hypothetical protein
MMNASDAADWRNRLLSPANAAVAADLEPWNC